GFKRTNYNDVSLGAIGHPELVEGSSVGFPYKSSTKAQTDRKAYVIGTTGARLPEGRKPY
ncbi:MAG: hypothetical protein RIF33_02950, partial [Cyclobacteriaceae bacterium]